MPSPGKHVSTNSSVDSTAHTSQSSESTSSSGTAASSSRIVTSLRKLVIDLKMDLAEALAKIDDLTLANQRLVRERDEARAEVRRLRRSQYMHQHGRSSSDRTVMHGGPPQAAQTARRRASVDGALPAHRTNEEGSRSSSLRNILSGLQKEVEPMDHVGDATNASAPPSPPPSLSSAPIAERRSSTTAPDDQAKDTNSARRSPSKSFDELQQRYEDISLDGDNRYPGPRVDSETNKAAGLTQIRQKVSNLSQSTRNAANQQHQSEDDGSSTPKEESELCNESYHEYTTKTNFNGSSNRNKDQGRSKKRLLVSELQIAQAKIAFGE